MNYLKIPFSMKHAPKLDPGFIPFGLWRKAYLEGAHRPFSIAVEREGGKISVLHTFLRGEEFAEANYRYAERTVKFLLWSVGGFRVYLSGDEDVIRRIRAAYTPGGERAFDVQFMQNVYERPFEIHAVSAEDLPEANESAVPAGGHMDGCRIGFDAGGSDRKVSAVIDGKCVYSEEVIWFPKLNEDPNYQYQEILTAFRTAASKMPRVDAIGVSSAGVFIGNAPMVSSIFYKVPRSQWDFVKTVFDRAAAEIDPNIPILVANDGDVSALAGAIGLGKGNLMGLAMGTSEAVGYVDADQNVLGWINELAFAPVDLQESAMQDEWSTDFGVGCKYFSQDAVVKLAPFAGIRIPEELPLAEKLKFVQKLMEADDQRAVDIFETIGAYLAYTTVLYSQFYNLDYMMLLGRVMSGKGGDAILRVCNEILRDEYPELAAKCTVTLPDEKMRRVGQSVAAASLPSIQ